jgi:hypothetical protein
MNLLKASLYVILLLSVSGCMTRSVYDNGFEEKRVSVFKVRSKNPDYQKWIPKHEYLIRTYYYPDSILDYKECISYLYDKSLKDYIVTGREKEAFDRETPYIPPIDTLKLISPIQLSETFTTDNRLIMPQSIIFNDSSQFSLHGQGASTSTTTPNYSYYGKYVIEKDTLTLYTQQPNSLKLSKVQFEYFTDSIIRISENDLYRKKYYIDNKK